MTIRFIYMSGSKASEKNIFYPLGDGGVGQVLLPEYLRILLCSS